MPAFSKDSSVWRLPQKEHHTRLKLLIILLVCILAFAGVSSLLNRDTQVTAPVAVPQMSREEAARRAINAHISAQVDVPALTEKSIDSFITKKTSVTATQESSMDAYISK
jgi:hypothetical protein